ncbi:MAG: C-GCAxxG-C-C family protein [Eubacteriales bacterium]
MVIPVKGRVYLSQPADDAVDMFKQGFVCSQAVFAAFCEKCSLEKSFALRIGSGFGAGIARKQEVCGAVTGAVMFLGLKYGKVRGNDTAAHEKAYDKVNVFCKRFIEKNKSIKCSELLGCSMAEAKEKKLFSTLCREFIRNSAEILEEMLLEAED